MVCYSLLTDVLEGIERSSSAVLAEKRGQKLYVSSALLASSVLVSGNNFEKVSLLAKGMNLKLICVILILLKDTELIHLAQHHRFVE